ncbi:unnamed protein product, partial [Closterium sp. Naga37s-1]
DDHDSQGLARVNEVLDGLRAVWVSYVCLGGRQQDVCVTRPSSLGHHCEAVP